MPNPEGAVSVPYLLLPLPVHLVLPPPLKEPLPLPLHAVLLLLETGGNRPSVGLETNPSTSLSRQGFSLTVDVGRSNSESPSLGNDEAPPGFDALLQEAISVKFS